MTLRNNFRACALVAGAALLATATSAQSPRPPAPAPVVIKIIGFNDYHGTLQSPGTFGVNTLVPSAQRPAVGGAEYMAAYISRLKSQNPLNVVVGGGDLIGATPLISALFFDEPAVETLNKMGLEFSSVGNHEFDKGSAELKRCRTAAARSPTACPIPTAARAWAPAPRAPSTARSSSGFRPT